MPMGGCRRRRRQSRWTLVLAASMMFLSALVWFGNLTAEAAFGEDWDAYLLLLGGPFASAVLAKGITAGKVSAGAIAKTPTDEAAATVQTTAAPAPGEPKAADLVSNDSGEISVPDTQYVIFTLVAIAYFVGALGVQVVDYAKGAATQITLPVIPSALLGLTSLAALTYVGSKAVERDGVWMVTVGPDDPKVSGDLTVTLVNVRAGASIGNVSLIWTSGDAAAQPRAATNMTSDDDDGDREVPGGGGLHRGGDPERVGPTVHCHRDRAMKGLQ